MYADDKYKIAGTVSIPEEKREEFNRNVEKILNVFGIRQTEMRVVGGRAVTVLKRPEADGNGIVKFNYSLFEKKIREGDSYDTKTCELSCPDRGYNEFGVAMNCILVMQEAYSQTPCFLMERELLCPVGNYAALIGDMTGVKLSFPHRRRILDILTFLKQTDGYRDINENRFWNRIWDDTLPFSTDDIVELVYVDIRSGKEEKENPFCGEKNEIKDAKLKDLFCYLIKEIKEYLADGSDEPLRKFFRELINSELLERRKLAEKDGVLGIIAEVSLRAPSTFLVSAYAEALGEAFWNVWFDLKTKGYRTWNGVKRDNLSSEPKNHKKMRLYKIYQRDNEDEFLEFGAENLSERLMEQINEWKKEMKEASVPEDFNTEDTVGQMLWDMEHVWNCRYVSEEAIENVLKHDSDVRCKKALQVFQRYMNAYQEYFPELPPEQATEWIIVRARDRYCRTIMAAFWSLMMNEKLRQDTFGF